MKSLYFILLSLLLASSASADTFRLDGATALSPAEVAAVLDPYEGTTIDAEDIAATINALNTLYREKGYLTSGVEFLPQPRTDVIVLEARESTLGTLNIVTDGRLRTGFLRDLIESELSVPLNIIDLQRGFNRLEQQHTINVAKGRLKPANEQGESTLELEIVEADAFSLRVAANNYRSPSIGDTQGTIQLRHLNLTGMGDIVDLSINHTDGMDSGSVLYDFPLNVLKSRVSLYYSRGDTLVVEVPFDAIDIESKTDTAGIRFETRFIESLSRTFSASLGFENKKSETTLLDLPYDFSHGSVDGRSEVAVVLAALSFQQRSQNQAIAVQATYRKGLDLLDATIIPGSISDGKFDLLQVQASYVRRFERSTNDWTFSARFNTQFTNDTLQSFERFALGGNNSVRGYRENQVLRDNAWELRLQLEMPLFQSDDSRFAIYPFTDAGRAKNSIFQPNVQQSVDLSSAGLGVLWQVHGLSVKAEWAKRLSEDSKQGDALQDHGVHIGVSYEI